MSTVVTCDECGAELRVNDWPFCKGDKSKHVQVGDNFHDGFEPYVDCQLLDSKDPRCTAVDSLGRRGVPITTPGDRQVIMREQGLQFGTQKFEDRGKRRYVDLGR